MFVKGGYCYFVHGEWSEIVKGGKVLIAGNYHVDGVRCEGYRSVCGAFVRLEKAFIKYTQRGSVD